MYFNTNVFVAKKMLDFESPPKIRIQKAMCGPSKPPEAMGFDLDLEVLPSTMDVWAIEEKAPLGRWVDGESGESDDFGRTSFCFYEC